MTSRLLLPLLLLSLAYAAPVGSPGDFAALTIKPSGPEEFDLETGVTTLPEGGEIVYRAEGVTLRGGFIRYREGDFIEIRGASVAGAFGTLRAPLLRFDVATQRLRAADGATFAGTALALEADAITLDLSEDTAVLSGGVTSREPALTASKALVDMTGQQGVLVGPYTFQDGPVTLRGDPGKLLALRWDTSGAVSAETQVPAALQTRFADELP